MQTEENRQPLNYARLNQYLLDHNQNNQKLYQYLQACKNNDGNFQNGNHLTEQNINNINWGLNLDGIIQKNCLLQQSQHQIFAEITRRNEQNCQFEKQLHRSQSQLLSLKNKLKEMRETANLKLCQKAGKQFSLTIESQKINTIRNQTSSILQQIELTKLLTNDINALTLKNQLKQQQLKKELAKLNSPSPSSLLKAKQELSQQIKMLQVRIQSNSKQIENIPNQSQMLECLNERKKIQEQLLEEEVEKQQFFEILEEFKANFKAAKQKNKKLKQQMAQKGLQLSKFIK